MRRQEFRFVAWEVEFEQVAIATEPRFGFFGVGDLHCHDVPEPFRMVRLQQVRQFMHN